MTRSKKIGLPVIHVAIKYENPYSKVGRRKAHSDSYRLGFFGFLASRDLLGEANNESVGNYGEHNQCKVRSAPTDA